MKRLIGILISLSLLMVIGCPQFRSNFLGEEIYIPVYLPMKTASSLVSSPAQSQMGLMASNGRVCCRRSKG